MTSGGDQNPIIALASSDNKSLAISKGLSIDQGEKSKISKDHNKTSTNIRMQGTKPATAVPEFREKISFEKSTSPKISVKNEDVTEKARSRKHNNTSKLTEHDRDTTMKSIHEKTPTHDSNKLNPNFNTSQPSN